MPKGSGITAKVGKLSDNHKKWIVTHLAMFYSPTQVWRMFLAEFPGTTVSLQAIGHYDPTRPGVKQNPPGKEWIALFHATRDEYLRQQARIGITHQTNRLHRLDRMASLAEQQGNLGLAKEIIELAAKEVGGALTNRRVVVDPKDTLARLLGVEPENLPTSESGGVPFVDPTQNGVRPRSVGGQYAPKSHTNGKIH